MPINTQGKAKRLTLTRVTTGTLGPINDIRNYDVAPADELGESRRGTFRTKSHWQGSKGGTIMIETADLTHYDQFEIGQKYTNVQLVCESAIDSGGTATGNEVIHTLSHAVVSEKGTLSHSNEDSTEVVYSITFELSLFYNATTEPTMTTTQGA